MRQTDSTLYVEVEEMVYKSSDLILGYRNETTNSARIVHIIAFDKEYKKGSLYLCKAGDIRRHKVQGKTAYFVLKSKLLAELCDNIDNYVPVVHVNLSKMKDERGGIPRLEYI